MTILAWRSDDAREQPTLPDPGGFYLTFQRTLAASEHIRTIASLLANTHWLYEGWGMAPLPLAGTMARLYQRAALMAVRLCSEPDASMAQSQAVVWGLAAFDGLQRELASPDAVEGVRAQAIGQFITTAITIHLHALEHGAHGSKHAAYQALIDQIADGTDEAVE